MRVIAGQWKGRRLLSPVGSEVRPTTDRVKEALFNILGPRVSGAEVLDVCCGGGGLGIEALSRGARRAVFVDIAPQCLDLVRRNLKHCGAADAAWLTLRIETGAAGGTMAPAGGSALCFRPGRAYLAANPAAGRVRGFCGRGGGAREPVGWIGLRRSGNHDPAVRQVRADHRIGR